MAFKVNDLLIHIPVHHPAEGASGGSSNEAGVRDCYRGTSLPICQDAITLPECFACSLVTGHWHATSDGAANLKAQLSGELAKPAQFQSYEDADAFEGRLLGLAAEVHAAKNSLPRRAKGS